MGCDIEMVEELTKTRSRPSPEVGLADPDVEFVDAACQVHETLACTQSGLGLRQKMPDQRLVSNLMVLSVGPDNSPGVRKLSKSQARTNPARRLDSIHDGNEFGILVLKAILGHASSIAVVRSAVGSGSEGPCATGPLHV